MNCRICRSEMKEFLELYDDRYGYPGLFRLDRCTGCGHAALRASFEPEQLASLYTEFYPRSEYRLEDYAPAPKISGLRDWLDGARCSSYGYVPERVRVLDIGCGFGEALGYHQARGCEVHGVEADANIRRVADRFSFQVQVGLFDPAMFEADYFDFVTMDQVIEHATDPVALLKGVAQVLKPGGRLILSSPNPAGWGAQLFGRRWINWHAPYHLQHFSRESLSLAAQQAGFSVQNTRTVTSSEWLHYQWIHLISFPPPGTPSPFWAPGHRGNSGRSGLRRVIDLVHRAKIDHLLTRLFDALGLGDNHLFFLRKHG